MHICLAGERPDTTGLPSEWVAILSKGWSQTIEDRPTILELSEMIDAVDVNDVNDVNAESE